jgi:hypothetical protein
LRRRGVARLLLIRLVPVLGPLLVGVAVTGIRISCRVVRMLVW